MEVFLKDLEASFDDQRRQDMDALVDDLADAERATITLAARISAAHASRINVVLRGGRGLSGTIVDAASTWVLIRGNRSDSLIPLSALVAAWPLGVGADDIDSLNRRIGIGHVLREMADRRVEVVIEHDAGRHQGEMIGVYSDHIDLAAETDGGRIDSRDRAASMVISLSMSGVRSISVAM